MALAVAVAVRCAYARVLLSRLKQIIAEYLTNKLSVFGPEGHGAGSETAMRTRE